MQRRTITLFGKKTRDNGGPAVGRFPFTREVRVQVRVSALDHEARSLSQGLPEPSFLTSGS